MSYYVYIAMMAFLVACFLTCRLISNGLAALFTKTLASLGFVFGAIVGINNGVYIAPFGYLILGLTCGLIGDILLDLKRIYKNYADIYLNSGMAIFGIGHIMYTIAICLLVGGISTCLKEFFISLGVGVVFAGILVFLLGKPLKLDFGKFKYQSAAYCCILTFVMMFSLLLSIRINNLWLLTAGFICFLVSDLVLSLQYFGGKEESKILTIVNHVTYYAAQVLIVGQIFFLF